MTRLNPSTALQRFAALGFFVLPVVVCSSAQAVTNYNYPTSTTITTKINGNVFIGRDNNLKYADSSGHPYNPVITLGPTKGGIANQAYLYNSSSLTLTSGYAIGESVNPQDTSTFTMTGGTVGTLNDGFSDVAGSGSATINVSGSSAILGNLISSGGVINYSGGSVGGQLTAQGTCVLTYSGGSVGSSANGHFLYDNGTATFNIKGTNLQATLVDPNAGGLYSEYTLSGLLADNVTSLSGDIMLVQNGTGANFEFNGQPAIPPTATTPAPGSLTVLLVGFAGAGFGLRRKRRE